MEGNPAQGQRRIVMALLGVLGAELTLLMAGVVWLMLILDMGVWLLVAAAVAALVIAYPLLRAAARRRFQFSIRTLLLAVAIWALLLGLGGTRLFRSWTQYRTKSLFAELGERGIVVTMCEERKEVSPIWSELPADYDPRDTLRVHVDDDNGLHLIGRYSDELANLGDLMLGGKATDADAADAGILRRFPKLEVLELLASPVTDAGLDRLTKSANPRVLFFNDCGNITDAGLIHLRDLSRLESLTLMTEGPSSLPITDAGLIHVGKIVRLKYLSLTGLKITDAGLAHLATLSNLETLNLGGTRITDAGLRHLRTLTNLRVLSLDHTQVSDLGLQQLRGLDRLQWLSLESTQVTDAGLAHLKTLTNLRELWLNGTSVTPQGVAELQKALPECTIDQ
jgi:hypothetical protein